MKVNSVNIAGMCNTSFGKAIKINTESARHNFYNPEIDPQTASIVDIIQGKKSHVFAKDKLNVLGRFLLCKIGDYNSEEGLVAEKIRGDVFIFTGKECSEAREILSEIKKDTAISRKQAELKKDFRLSEVIGRAKQAGKYEEIDADFNNNEFEFLTYKDSKSFE